MMSRSKTVSRPQPASPSSEAPAIDRAPNHRQFRLRLSVVDAFDPVGYVSEGAAEVRNI
jgi:hypothetical protein